MTSCLAGFLAAPVAEELRAVKKQIAETETKHEAQLHTLERGVAGLVAQQETVARQSAVDRRELARLDAHGEESRTAWTRFAALGEELESRLSAIRREVQAVRQRLDTHHAAERRHLTALCALQHQTVYQQACLLTEWQTWWESEKTAIEEPALTPRKEMLPLRRDAATSAKEEGGWVSC